MKEFKFEPFSEKLKKCRVTFNITQYKLSKFGINQNYLSMIESQKRVPSKKMKQKIYHAFRDLTEDRIKNMYTEKEFTESLEEKILAFSENIEELVQNQHVIITELKKYNCYTELYNIYDMIANYYIMQYDFKSAYKIFLESLKIVKLNYNLKQREEEKIRKEVLLGKINLLENIIKDSDVKS